MAVRAGERVFEDLPAGLFGARIGDGEAGAVIHEHGNEIGARLGVRGRPLGIEQTENQQTDAKRPQSKGDGGRLFARDARAQGKNGQRHKHHGGGQRHPPPGVIRNYN